MGFLTDITIESFRGVTDLQLKNLGEINIIAGINNSGKTSILEALLLLESPLDFTKAVKVSRRRELIIFFGDTGVEQWDSFINLFNQKTPIKKIALFWKTENQNYELCLEGVIEKRLIDEEQLRKKIKNNSLINPIEEVAEAVSGETEFFNGVIRYVVNENPTEKKVEFSRYDKLKFSYRPAEIIVKMRYISPIDHIISNIHLNRLIKEGLKSEIVDLLKLFDSEITGLEMIGNLPYLVHADLKPMPLSTYGDGVKKVLLLASSIINAKKGILLIDEIETSIHVSVLEKIYDWFVKACRKYEVQVFATTHSLEAIDALLKSVKDNQEIDPIRIITLKKHNQRTHARIFHGKEARSAREEFELEMRQ